jgi:hypothetical protein
MRQERIDFNPQWLNGEAIDGARLSEAQQP